MKLHAAAATVLLLFAASAARAQSLNLQMENGRVTLRAQNVPARAILAEWARVGGTRIVNGERVTGAPLTLELENVPERQALDIVLRTVSGYMLAPRQAGAGLSTFDRILILPTSTPPRNAGPAPMPGNAATPATGGNAMAPGINRGAPPELQIAPIDENDSEENPPEDVPIEDNEGEGEPSIAPAARPFGTGGAAGQVSPAQPEGEGEENSAPEGETPAPANPFFNPPPGSTSLPGVVTPVPQQPRQPGARPTPPPPPPDAAS